MSDNKIRCAVAYRLDGGKGSPKVTMLAKYDHAGKATSDGGTLYGARDKNFADAVAVVIKNDPPSSVSDAGVIGGFKVVTSDMHQVIYGADDKGLSLCVIAGLKYPSRTAIQMLTELYGKFAPKFGLQAQSATVNSLTTKSKPMLRAVCEKYDDLSKVDKAKSLIGQVDSVKGKMQNNIAGMLSNTEKADSLAERSNQLNEQANVFKKKSTDLKKHMRCKNLKMTLILSGVVIGILCIILIPLISKSKKE
jgi:vesicle-associated membrane protein 7